MTRIQKIYCWMARKLPRSYSGFLFGLIVGLLTNIVTGDRLPHQEWVLFSGLSSAVAAYFLANINKDIQELYDSTADLYPGEKVRLEKATSYSKKGRAVTYLISYAVLSLGVIALLIICWIDFATIHKKAQQADETNIGIIQYDSLNRQNRQLKLQVEIDSIIRDSFRIQIGDLEDSLRKSQQTKSSKAAN